MAAGSTYRYLCLLDNLHLKESLQIGEYQLEKVERGELLRILGINRRTRSTKMAQYDIDLWSQFPWVTYKEVPSVKKARHGTKFSPQFIQLLNDRNFYWRNTDPLRTWPFEPFIRALNLLKEGEGPVIPCHIIAIRQVAGNEEIVGHITRRQPETKQDGPDEDEYSVLGGQSVTNDDRAELCQLLMDIEKYGGQKSNYPSLSVAIEFFSLGDSQMKLYPEGHAILQPLIAYESALESLLLREKEKGSDAKNLARRVCRIIDSSSLVFDFAKRVHWLRSKYVHGVLPLNKLRKYVITSPNQAITDSQRSKASTPSGNYKSMLMKSVHFPGLLVNLREVVRLCIRYCLEQASAGQSQEDVIKVLDAKGK